MLQESRQLKIGEEISFATAIENTKIKSSSIEEIKEILRLVMIKIGLRSANWPSNEEKMVLIEHIISKYGNHTCEEIKLAFDLAIEGKLDLKETNCYENFSCLYFSNVMNSYRNWAKEVYKQISETPKILIEEKKEITDKDMIEWIDDWEYKLTHNVLNPMLIPNSFYDWLTKKEMLVLNKEQKIDYLENQAVTYRHYHLSEQAKMDGQNSEANKDLIEFNEMVNKGCFTGIEVTRLKELAKKIAVFDYLKNRNVIIQG